MGLGLPNHQFHSIINGFRNYIFFLNLWFSGGTNRAARVQFSKLGMTFSFVDFSNLEEVENAIKPNTKILFSEVPSNPTLTLSDLRGISDIAKRHGLLHACDSTFATPLMIRPLDHGADIVIQVRKKELVA